MKKISLAFIVFCCSPWAHAEGKKTAHLGIYSVSMGNPKEDGTFDATVTLGGHSCAGEEGAITITLTVPNVKGPAEAREKVKPKLTSILQGLQDDISHCEK